MTLKNSATNRTVYLRILNYLRPYSKFIILVLIFNLGFIIFSALSVWMVAPVITAIFDTDRQEQVQTVPEVSAQEDSDISIFDINDWLKLQMRNRLQTKGPKALLKILCVIIFLCFTLKNLFAFGEFFWVSYVEQKVIRDLREQLYEHILKQPLQFFSNNPTGNLISRITNDINAVNVAVNRSFTKLIRDPVIIFLFIYLLFSINWQLTAAAMVIFPLSTVIIQNIGRSLRRKSRRVQERIASITDILQEAISGIKVVKAFGMEDYESRKFRRATGNHFKAVLKQVRLHRLSSPISETLGVGVMACLLWYGGNMVLGGQLLNSEDFLRFIILLFSMMDPIKSLGELNNNVQIALASGKRIFEVLDTPTTIIDKPGAVQKVGFEHLITFENVSFKYPNSSEWVLSKLNLNIEKNQQVALVGSSGAGKTTCANLLPRFYDVGEGQIKIDGIDIRNMTVASLRNLMGIVTQEVILFNDTVANNIAYGKTDYSMAEIENAARLANAFDFIMKMPEGFQTKIGERGVLISGGQRQRISIARAILKNPPILIFDEATSSLDSESEHFIQEAVENLIKDRTVLIIAHRLSSVINCDKIVVIQNGKTLDEGSHKTLLNRSSSYRRFCKLQLAN